MHKLKTIAVAIPLVLPIVTGCASAQRTERAAISPTSGTVARDTALVKSATRPRGYTGFSISVGATAGQGGVVHVGYPTITDLRPGSPAAKAGLLLGDIILEANGTDLSLDSHALFPAQMGVKYVLRIKRGVEEKELTLIPIEMSVTSPIR